MIAAFSAGAPPIMAPAIPTVEALSASTAGRVVGRDVVVRGGVLADGREVGFEGVCKVQALERLPADGLLPEYWRGLVRCGRQTLEFQEIAFDLPRSPGLKGLPIYQAGEPEKLGWTTLERVIIDLEAWRVREGDREPYVRRSRAEGDVRFDGRRWVGLVHFHGDESPYDYELVDMDFVVVGGINGAEWRRPGRIPAGSRVTHEIYRDHQTLEEECVALSELTPKDLEAALDAGHSIYHGELVCESGPVRSPARVLIGPQRARKLTPRTLAPGTRVVASRLHGNDDCTVREVTWVIGDYWSGQLTCWPGPKDVTVLNTKLTEPAPEKIGTREVRLPDGWYVKVRYPGEPRILLESRVTGGALRCVAAVHEGARTQTDIDGDVADEARRHGGGAALEKVRLGRSLLMASQVAAPKLLKDQGGGRIVVAGGNVGAFFVRLTSMTQAAADAPGCRPAFETLIGRLARPGR